MSLILLKNRAGSNTVSVPIRDAYNTRWTSTSKELYTEINEPNDNTYIVSPLNRRRMQVRFRMSQIDNPTGIVKLYIRPKI